MGEHRHVNPLLFSGPFAELPDPVKPRRVVIDDVDQWLHTYPDAREGHVHVCNHPVWGNGCFINAKGATHTVLQYSGPNVLPDGSIPGERVGYIDYWTNPKQSVYLDGIGKVRVKHIWQADAEDAPDVWWDQDRRALPWLFQVVEVG